MEEKKKQAIMGAIWSAFIECPHTITADVIEIKRSNAAEGNALYQLHERIWKKLDGMAKDGIL